MKLLLTIFAALWVSGCSSCSDDSAGIDFGTLRDAGVDGTCVDCDGDADGGVERQLCEGPTCVCRIGRFGGSCATPNCTVSVEAGVLSRERLFSLTEDTVVGDPGAELLGRRACRWETDARPEDLSREYEVALRFDEAEIPETFTADEVVGVLVDIPTLATAAVTDVSRMRVSLGVTEPAALGATVLPAAPIADKELGRADFNPLDAAGYFRNVSRFRFSSVFMDDQRLYIGNGPRLLIWNDGIPPSPATPPDVVLGRPDLVGNVPQTSASSFTSAVDSVWSDGTRLAIAEGNRVLIWQRIPTEDFTPADLVLGQDNFSDNKVNKNGGPGANTLAEPGGIWSDGTRFAVSDQNNHRVLIWNTFPSISGQPADVVVGQPTFDTNTLSGGELPLYQARGVYFDGAHFAVTSVFVCNCVQVIDGFPSTNNLPRDYGLGSLTGGNRVTFGDFNRAGDLSRFGSSGLVVHNASHVSVFRDFPSVETALPDFTIGKPSGEHGAILGRISASSFSTAATQGSLFADDQRLLVADGYRVLVWDTLPDTGFVAADRALGQPSAATSEPLINYAGISDGTLAYPAAVSRAGDVTAIADRANNRVLIIRGPVDDPSSVVVVGQPSGTSFLAEPPSATTLDTPTGVSTDGSRLVVADSGNHRVLVWDTVPTTNGAPADHVLGQIAFDAGAQNGGAADLDGDTDLDASDATLHYPSGVWADADTIAVADTFNHRVLIWEGAVPNGAGATRIIGQPDGMSNEPNRGAGWFTRDGSGLSRPMDVEVMADGRVAVADSENNRVLLFGAGDTAEVVLGQPDLVTDGSPNWLTGFASGWPATESGKTTDSALLRWPSALAVQGVELVVADTGNNRVVRYVEPFVNGMPADAVWGQAALDERSANAGGLGAGSMHRPEGVAFTSTGIVVADTSNHRLLELEPGEREARALFGQSVFAGNGINGSSPAFDTLDGPAGFSIVDGAVWVADRGHHRVVAFETDKLSRVLGQFDRGGGLRHAGFEAPRPWTMSQPSDIWTDGVIAVVADRDNHRVLIWNEIPEDPTVAPDVVLGQPDGLSNEANAGGITRATASTMLGPEGVLVAGGRLYVADSGNNRVLIWDELPTQTGAPADRVLCQPSFDANESNRGAADPSAASCATPTDVLRIDDELFVVDSLNHRVLRFDAGASSAAEATLVLGQPDFVSRQPLGAQREPTAAIFNNPTRIAHDGRTLFVVDRGNHRVLLFDAVPTQSSVAADRVLGQGGFDTAVVTDRFDGLEAPDGIFVTASTYNRTAVWVSDSGHDRLVRFDRVARKF